MGKLFALSNLKFINDNFVRSMLVNLMRQSKFEERKIIKKKNNKILLLLPLTSSYSYPLHYVQFSFGSVNHKTEKQN